MFQALAERFPEVRLFLERGLAKIKIQCNVLYEDAKVDACTEKFTRAINGLIHRAIDQDMYYTDQEFFGTAFLANKFNDWFLELESESKTITVNDVRIANFCVNRRNQVPKKYQYLIDNYLMHTPTSALYMVYFLNLGFSADDLSKFVSENLIKVPENNLPGRTDFFRGFAHLLKRRYFYPKVTSDTPRVRQVKDKNV